MRVGTNQRHNINEIYSAYLCHAMNFLNDSRIVGLSVHCFTSLSTIDWREDISSAHVNVIHIAYRKAVNLVDDLNYGNTGV